MKRTIATLALAALAIPAFADPSPTAAPAGNPPPPRHEGGREWGRPRMEALESMTPAERQQLQAARQKAKSDPALIEARKKAMEAQREFRAAEKAAMLKADPAVAPLLEKIEQARKERPRKGAPEAAPETAPEGPQE